MLLKLPDEKVVGRIPHRAAFAAWYSKMSHHELAAIRSRLDSMIEGDEIHTSSWMPGTDWSGSPFLPIFETACGSDREAAALCFSLFVWEAIMRSPDRWSFGRYSVGDVQIKGMTYFRLF